MTRMPELRPPPSYSRMFGLVFYAWAIYTALLGLAVTVPRVLDAPQYLRGRILLALGCWSVVPTILAFCGLLLRRK